MNHEIQKFTRLYFEEKYRIKAMRNPPRRGLVKAISRAHKHMKLGPPSNDNYDAIKTYSNRPWGGYVRRDVR